MAFSYTNRKGKTYFLHARATKRGKVRHVFSRSLGEGALDELPKGHEVAESVNGVVSLKKKRPRVIARAEEAAVRKALAELSLDTYRVEAKDATILVHRPLRSMEIGTGDLLGFSPFGSRARHKEWVRKGQYEPILRFTLVDRDARKFEVTRWVFRGEGSWSWALGAGSIEDLARSYLPHLGKDSFFELM